VLYNAKTQLFVLWYNYVPDYSYGVATSPSAFGPFQTVNSTVGSSFRFGYPDNKDIGDFSVWTDDDGTGYFLYSAHAHCQIERLTDDYLASTWSTTNESSAVFPHGNEAPALFKRGALWYALVSESCCYCKLGGKVHAYSSTAPLGPYDYLGEIASGPNPFGGSIATASQETNVFAVALASGETAFMWQGDRWQSAPDKLKSHDFTFWAPLQFDDNNGSTIEKIQWVDSFSLDLHAAAPPCRDRFLEPFSAASIWNTAIGSEAAFAPARLFTEGDPRGLPGNFHNDQDFIVRGSPSDPLTDWINQGDWGADEGGKCAVQKGSRSGLPCGGGAEKTLHGQLDGCVAQIRLPRNWTSASDCDGAPSSSGDNCRSAADQVNNNAMALLLADNVTLVQMQPVYRCGFYPSPLLARWGNVTDGGPQRFANVTSILGDGTGGAHGGSGLSSIGGSVRLGELAPGAPPIAHALKIELGNWWYYGSSQLNPKTADNGGRSQYVWPATGSNAGYTNGSSGSYTGTNPHVAPGALLAIPAANAAAVNVTTTVGGALKQAMVDYGAYIVDGSGRGPNNDPLHRNLVAICMDAEVNAEMRNYGFNMAYPNGTRNPALDPTQTPAQNDLYDDLLRIFQALHAVTNNGPDSIGGGGTPRRPTKGPICE